MDTIYALATARGRSGLAVVRISGPGAFAAGLALCGSLPAARVAGLRRLVWDGELLDEALVVSFAEGASFTGEAVVELHCHGGPAVVGTVLRALSAQPGLRLAEPGEFTRRALENGVLDLAQVEGLADLIDAETEAQRRQAVRVLSGSVGQKVDGWRRDLIRAGALLEATIDFADEDVPVDVSPEVLALIDGLMADLGREAAGVTAAERIRDGFEVAIVGAPNAGKSTLLNQLAGREAAITSEIAGTTRDVIEVRMEIAGLPVTFLDTAGLRDTEDRLERAGIERALARAECADLRLFLTDGSPLLLEPMGDDLVVMGKSDTKSGWPGLAVSGKTGQGVPELMARIGETLSQRVGSAGALVRERHRVAVTTAIAALAESRAEVVRPDSRVELAAEHLRQAVRALDALVGRVDVDDLLGEIFASFCIGK
ncbi:MAG: tRNA uridine-5-carboxymethylaminomethyl(34) synthesis GTPase MnmE [Tabrizicola sp.]|uniref:tRNA uridine-5-carboxymethylaminomethyl(34) synthesis GTPase MnmE n=1 Tax=Tabrizicola sp. TaxID=2005166 RepID=UPI002AB9C6E7|nr:tRNA uridine-5-carboxymethylaminomethyl(34) synthesis GTPase MnmE [Tabrizicola sp.]MDZ4089006.1 tRNA uridine-5-carboxymethylaminomethyl(34) synthesis GTPase MnmE [Tabrizicola sp.]